MKNKIIRFFHALLGWENYLFVFTVFKIYTLRWDKRKKDYLFFVKEMPANASVLIIGACTGITTIPVAKKAAQGIVKAIEPVPFNYKTIEKAASFFKLKNVQVLPVALGDTDGEIEMVLPLIENTRKQGFAHVVDSSITEYNEGSRFIVPVMQLDHMAEFDSFKVTGIKIVAENYEKQIFMGAKKFILKNRPLIYCELWANKNRQEVMALVQSWGYSIMVNDGEKLTTYNSAIHKEKFFFFKMV